MHFQWYPGHMTKAKRAMQEDIKLVDLVIELVDARIPLASRNPDIDELGKHKSRVILLNKADLADDHETAAWQKYFDEAGYVAVRLDSRSGAGKKPVQEAITKACKEKIERDRKRGILNRPVRAMVVGIPNVGKSTLINSLAGRACAKTGNKPGVTRGNQWIRLNKQVELLDTPGMLWPKFDDQQVGLYLALIGSMNDAIVNPEDLAVELIKMVNEQAPKALDARYATGELTDPVVIMDAVAKQRGCLLQGGEIDYQKAARLVLDDFRSGRLGKITLETVSGKIKCMENADE